MLYAGRTVGITLCTYAGRVKDSKPIQLQLSLSGTVGAGSDAAEQTVEFQRRLRTGIVQPREKSADLCLSAQAAGKGPESPRYLVLFKTVWLSKWLCAGLVQQLLEKLCESQDFPHEIGLFLGYPFEDVRGLFRTEAVTAGFAGIGRCTPTSVRKSACLKSIAIAVMSIAGNGQKGCPSSGLRSPVKVSIF